MIICFRQYDILSGPLLHLAHTVGVIILPYHCRLDPEEGTVELLGRMKFVDTYADIDSKYGEIKTDIIADTTKTEKRAKKTGVDNSNVPKKRKRISKLEFSSSITDMTTETCS